MRLGIRLPLLTVILIHVAFAGERTSGAEVRSGDRVFHVPDGFVVEKVAGPPLVDRPIVADFDEQGRLYVADSSGSNDNVNAQLANPTHRIVRLEDADGDGVYDRSTVFADKMMFPEGAMWREGSLYVAAPPSIWKLTDTDGDGKADKREEWFQGKTLTGCANDLHGPYNGPDGWIYWCKGAFAKQTYERPGKSPFVTRASHIFRTRPDGSGIEPVMTGGMDNPVEVAFSLGGERFFTTTFLQHPGGGKRDGLIHAVYGGVWGKDHDVLDGHIRTGPDLMPVMTHLGPAAPSGLMRYESGAFGADHKDNLFAALFNLHKVTRHVLEPDGATFKTRDSDFVSAADNLDFHPTDVLEHADGSLIVLDTGGWYKLCCPTSQIGKPDVLGAIYRVRKADARKVEDAWGEKLNWTDTDVVELCERLDDARPVVRRRAADRLAKLGGKGIPTISGTVRAATTPEGRVAAVRVATRIDHPDARAAVSLALRHPDEAVRQAALHGVALWRDRGAIAPAMELLRGSSPQNARAAAEAIGRIGEPLVVPDLLRAAAKAGDDRVLEHSIIYAAIEINDADQVAKVLDSSDPNVRRAAMIALDQMGAPVPADSLGAALASSPRLREAAEWICERHPEHAAVVVASLREALAKSPKTAEDVSLIERRLARFGRWDAVGELIVASLNDPETPRDVRLALLRAVARSGRKSLPREMAEGALAAMTKADAETVRQAVATVRAVPIARGQSAGLEGRLRQIAGDAAMPAALRLDALNAIPGGLADLDSSSFAFLRDQVGPDQPISARLAAADVLARATLTGEQLGSVADALKTAGPLEADRMLAIFEGKSDDAAGLRLVAALKDSPALASLRVETLKPRLAKFGEPVKTAAEALYARIEKEASGQKAKLDAMLASMSEGDVRRGQVIFNGSKAACSTCHAIGYLGGNVGPDLSSIGKIRGDRDLLESIVFPSASFVRSYEPMAVATKSGQVHSGLLKKDSPDEVVLATAADKVVSIPRAEVEEIKPGTISVMPAGLDQQLSKQDLADLLAFLRSRK